MSTTNRVMLSRHLVSERNAGRDLGEILEIAFREGLHGRRLNPNISDVVASVRADRGFKESRVDLLTAPSDNDKLRAASVPSYGLTLAHEKLHESLNLCPWAGDCTKVCVLNNGNGRYDSVQRAWLWRTDLFHLYPSTAVFVLGWELGRAVRKHGRILFRPDVNSDLSWHQFLPELGGLDRVTVYGYTKNPAVLSAHRSLQGRGFHYAYSHHERSNRDRERSMLLEGGKIAVVTDRKKMEPIDPWVLRRFFGVGPEVPVVDADITDQWMLADYPVIGDLSAKGQARKLIGNSDFVVRVRGGE